MLNSFFASLLAIMFLSSPSIAADTNAPAKEYGIKSGSVAPQIAVTDVDGKAFDLHAAAKKGPVVLVFYRGGWCPYCNLQLRNLQAKVSKEIEKVGGTIVAVSVDKVDEGLKTKGKEQLSATILSDPDAKILADYNVQFKVPDELVAKYKNEYKIDVEGSSGRKHHIIAVPAVFVLNKSAHVTYRFVEENYKIRAPEADILKAVQAAAGS